MTLRNILFILFLIFSSNGLRAQHSIAGKVADSSFQPLPFATIVLQADSSFIAGATADESGHFAISTIDRLHGHYTLTVSLMGYQTLKRNFSYPDTAFLSHIILARDKRTLAGVTIAGKKPLVIRKADRYIVDVENSFLANGNSGLDVLRKSPGVWVSNNGSIRIKGSQSVLVMINDVVQRMSEEELAEYLKTIRSENISKIEVIANPPSEFEAAGAGGIIHIILKKVRNDGFSGGVSTQYRQQGTKPYYGGTATADYRVKNLYLSGAYSYVKDKSIYLATNNIVYPDKGVYSSRTDRDNNAGRHQYRFGIALDIGKTQTINLQTLATVNDLNESFITGIRYLPGTDTITGVANSGRTRDANLQSTTLNYVWRTDSSGSQLKVIADYTNSSKTELNNFSSRYNDPLRNSTYRNNTPNNTSILSLQADYTKVLKNKTEIKGGTKLSAVKRDNEIIREDYTDDNWVLNGAGSNHFIYKEYLLMFYSSAEKTLGRVVLKAGLRAEQTYTKGNSVTSGQKFDRNYFGLFPSFFMMYTLNETQGNSIRLNYTRRLQRPSFTALNPYRLQFDDYTVLIGNPNLLPQYSHNISTGYTFRNEYTAELYFSRTNNVIAELASSAGNNVIEYQSRNFTNSTEYGVSLEAPFKVMKGWTVNNSFSLYNLSYRLDSFSINRTSFSLKSIHTIVWNKVIDIDVVADYRSPYVSANSRIPHMFSFDLEFTRRILKNQGRVRLFLADIFNTLREKETTDYYNTHIDFYQKRPTRIVGVAFSYTFRSGKKFSNKKIDQGNTDEKGRIGN
ncbi:outer membrane beta-barrel family protein [Chitinophaga sancti]|uniref:Outer membrane receptor proteins, mostly Fe transport n=1 Tax=Chitinophaga sancti TaxID=1004 RepID=A0A1K1M5P1_9BACT|nr:outer membrane beta-barrel family protein [Chitinophaga sancti]WQD64610.1 TonB-dependent receptor family protein [Chitinophaga sancti]WQG89766.1 TonB-dependent receptor family protein [Chitinophaga sancti]SFW18490.1 Outer membrane receptor proteins, mostly Fe transport [Chitinophaga sancti]